MNKKEEGKYWDLLNSNIARYVRLYHGLGKTRKLHYETFGGRFKGGLS
jgi:hypothetical protein